MGIRKRRDVIGEVLKDQAMTNLELLYDEFIGTDEYETQKIEKLKIEDGCTGCKHYDNKKCLHGIRHGIECIDNDYKYKEAK